MDHLPGFAWMKDIDGRYVYVNKKEAELDAYHDDGAIGKRDADLWPAEIASAYEANDRLVIATGKALQTVEPSLASGEPSSMMVCKFPILDQDGSVVMVAGAGVDMTDLVHAEKALNAQALRYKTLMETSTDSIYVLDENGDLQEANTAFLRRRGYTAAEAKGLNVVDWDTESDPDQLQERIRRLVDSSEVFDTRHRCKDGSVFYVEVSATAVRISGEQLFLCVARDITERKRAEERLQEYEKVVEGLEEMIVVVDRDYRYLLANRAFLKYRGLEREQLIGRVAKGVLDEGSFESVVRPRLEECLKGNAVKYEMRYSYPCHGERDLLISYFPIEGPSGIDRVACVLQDITERKLAEDRLRRSEEKFKALFDLAPVGISVLDRQRNIIDANPALEQITRLSREELLSGAHRRRAVLNADGTPKPPDEFPSARAISEGRSINDVDAGMVLENGEIIWVQVSVAPLDLPEASAVVITQDITERKRAEQALWQSLNLLRAITEGTIDAIYAKDREGRYLMVNTVGARFENKTPEEVIGLDDTHLFSGETLARILERDRAVMETGETRTDEDIVTTPDGVGRIHLTTKGPLRDPAGTIVGLFGVSRDITENKRAEQALRESEQRFRELAENINEVFWLSDDQNARMHYISPAYERVWGRSCESLYAAPKSWMEAVHPEDKEQVLATVAKRSLNERYHNTYRIVRPDGSIRWIRDRGFPVRDESGVAVRFAGIAEDITERKRTEQARERGLSLMLATLESTADGILVVNTEGKIETFNRLFARMWRLPDEVLASKEDARALECALDQLSEPEKFLEHVDYLYHHPEVESFDQLVFKDGRVFERYSRPQLIGGKVAGRVWSFRDVTERGRAAKALEEANDQLRFLSRRLFQVQEDERRHLARELHDEIGQTLTAAKINLDSIELANGQTQAPRLKETITLLDNLLRQVRQISLDLHPSLLDDLGLVPALRSLLDQQARRTGLRVQFSAPEPLQPVDLGLQTTAFRIAQEAITNVLRHAGSQSVGVNLSIEAGQLRMRIVDDGNGFDLMEVERRPRQDAGFGLIGMKERAALVGGGLHVISSPGKGTAIEVFLPLTLRPPHASR
jgi:PAS domain S-box-containing protein